MTLQMRICGVCHNDFEPRRIDQISCSQKCKRKRNTLLEKDRREKNKVKIHYIEIPCQYPGCKETILRGGQISNKKYCEYHARIRILESKQKQNDRRNKERLDKQIPRYCLNCNGKLGKWRTKYCSKDCKWKSVYQQRKKQKVEKKLERALIKVRTIRKELKSL